MNKTLGSLSSITHTCKHMDIHAPTHRSSSEITHAFCMEVYGHVVILVLILFFGFVNFFDHTYMFEKLLVYSTF